MMQGLRKPQTGEFLPWVLLLLFTLVVSWMVRESPPVWVRAPIQVTPGAAILGNTELGSPWGGVERRHLGVRFDGKEGWLLSNVSLSHRVFARFADGHGRELGLWPLQQGDAVQVDLDRVAPNGTHGRVTVKVQRADAQVLELLFPDGTSLRWEGGSLILPKGATFSSACPTAWGGRGRWFMARWFDREARLFSLGGTWPLHCPDRLALPGIPHPQVATVHYQLGRFWLEPGLGLASVRMKRGDRSFLFQEIETPLEGSEEGTITQITIGRTLYRIGADAQGLQLVPLARQDVWTESRTEGEAERALTWIGEGPEWRKWLGGNGARLALWGVLLLLVMEAAKGFRKAALQHGWNPPGSGRVILSTTLGVGALLWVLLLPSPGVASQFVLAGLVWAGATLALGRTGWLQGSGGMVWSGALFLAGCGALVLGQLAAGAQNTRILDYAAKHLQVLIATGGIFLVGALITPAFLEQRFVRHLPFWNRLIGVGVGVLCLLLTGQFFTGTEQGAFGIQPAEMAKLLLVVAGGFAGMYLGELNRLNPEAFRQNRLRLLWPFIGWLLVGISFSLLVLFSVRDFSPILILSVWSMAWVWRVASPPPPRITGRIGMGVKTGLILAWAGLALAAWWLHDHPQSLPEWFPARDRVLVWSDLEAHLTSGYQVNEALGFAALGGWFGAGGWFGGNGPVMHLPVVQNDFIGSFILYRFGGAAAVVLILGQILYLWGMLRVAGQARRWGEGAGDFHARMAGETLHLVVFGLACVHGAQWGIAWGNVLGLLPVMGQPMTWIAAGSTHLLTVGVAGLILTMLTDRLTRR